MHAYNATTLSKVLLKTLSVLLCMMNDKIKFSSSSFKLGFSFRKQAKILNLYNVSMYILTKKIMQGQIRPFKKVVKVAFFPQFFEKYNQSSLTISHFDETA